MFLEKVIKDVDCYLSTRQSVSSVLLFPPLNNWRRFLIHQTVCDSYAIKHSLSSLSVGEGAGRRIALCDSSLIKDQLKATPIKPSPITFVPQQNIASPFTLQRSSGGTERVAGRGLHSTSSQLTHGENGLVNTNSRKVARSNKGVMNIYTPPHLRKGNEMVNSGEGVGRGENEMRLLTSSENLERRCKTDPPTKINRTRRPDMKVYVPRALRNSLPSGTTNAPAHQVSVKNNAIKCLVANSANQTTENKGTRNDFENTFTKDTKSLRKPAREIITNFDKNTSDDTLKNSTKLTSPYTANQNKYIPPPVNTLYSTDVSPARMESRIPSLSNNPIENLLTDESLHSNNSHLETTFINSLSEPITLVSQELGQEQNETLKILNNAEMRSDGKTSSGVDIVKSNIDQVDHISNSKYQETCGNGYLISENAHDTHTIAQTIINSERNSLFISARYEDTSTMEVDSNSMSVSKNDDMSTIMDADENLTKENKFDTSDNVVDTIREVNSALVNVISSEQKNTAPSSSMNVEDGHLSSIDQGTKESNNISSEFETKVSEFTALDNEYAVINVCGTLNEVPSKVRLVETNFHSNNSSEKSSESLPSSAFNSNLKTTSESTSDPEIDSKVSDTYCITSASLETTMSCCNDVISADVNNHISSASHPPSEPSSSVGESPEKSLTPLAQSISDSDSKMFESELESELLKKSVEFSQRESVSESSSSVSTPTKSMSQVSLNLPSSKLNVPVCSDAPSKAVPEVSLIVPSSPKSDIVISHNVPSLIEANTPISSNVPSPSKAVPEVSSILSPPTTPVSSKQTNTTAPMDLNPEECDWETLYDDDGECLVPDIMNQLMNKMGKVSVQTPTQEYRSYQTPEERTSDGENILEIYGFSSTLTNRDLMDVFAPYARTSFHIKWVDDTHALGVFASPLVADEVLNTNLPNVKTRPLREAIPLSRAKAKTLLAAPCGPRPKTCLSSARRLVSGALGIRVQVSESKREEERQILKDAREKKRQEARQRQDIWKD